MKTLSKLSTLIAFIFTMVLTSCEQPIITPVKENSTEEILSFIQNTYKVDYMEAHETYYKIVFDNPTPFTLNKEYPDGIKEIILHQTDIYSINDDSVNISIVFQNGKSVTLRYAPWIDIEFNRTIISFGEQKKPETLSFIVKKSDYEIGEIKVEGHEEYATCEVTYDKEKGKGTILFTPITDEYFQMTIKLTVSHDKRSRFWNLPMVRANFKFEDGTTEKSFEFPEYPRIFGLQLDRYDTTVFTVVPKNSSGWLKVEVDHYKLNNEDKTKICFTFNENIGTTLRSAKIAIKSNSTDKELVVNISQIGDQMEGSFKKGLYAFYNALNGNQWRNNDNWLSDKPYYEWHGLRYNSDYGEVDWNGTKMTVYGGTYDKWLWRTENNNLQGEIPMEFWQISKYFTSIEMTYDYLPTSTVPACVWHENLEFLVLDGTHMNVPLTANITNAKKLFYLRLRNCNIGEIPEYLCELTDLRWIDFSNPDPIDDKIRLTGQIPRNIGKLKNLECIDLSENPKFSGTIPDSFYELQNLLVLDIQYTNIGGMLSSKIKNLTKLYRFKIANCDFQGECPEEIGNLKELQFWNIERNRFSKLPQFTRYRGNRVNFKYRWHLGGFTVTYFPLQRKSDFQRPDDYFYYEPVEITVNGITYQVMALRFRYGYENYLPFPKWAQIKWGMRQWDIIPYIDGKSGGKYPEWPYADDLQYSAEEYYYDGKDWRHPKLQYPAREYVFDGTNWIHDPTCPWDAEIDDTRQEPL